MHRALVRGGLDFAELAEDIAAEVRIIKALDVELEAIERRIEVLYDDADPAGVVRSMPSLGVNVGSGDLGSHRGPEPLRLSTSLVSARSLGPCPRSTSPAWLTTTVG